MCPPPLHQPVDQPADQSLAAPMLTHLVEPGQIVRLVQSAVGQGTFGLSDSKIQHGFNSLLFQDHYMR